MKEILEGYSTKDLAWKYKSFLDECLPEPVKKGSVIGFTPEHYLKSIAKQQKKLDVLNNTPLEELIEKEITDYYKWMESVEASLTDKQKVMREKCNNTIAELKSWQPEAECSKHLKTKLMELIKNNIEYDLYEWMGHPEIFTSEFARQQILQERERLTLAIKNSKCNYRLAVEYEKKIALLENQLKKDLELL